MANGIILEGLSVAEEEYAVGQPQSGQAVVQADEILQQVVASKVRVLIFTQLNISQNKCIRLPVALLSLVALDAAGGKTYKIDS